MANSDDKYNNTLYEEEVRSKSVLTKTRESPFMVIGLTGCTLACLYGIYNYRRRGKTMTTSRYLMQLRVTAQGTVVACLTLGALYSVYNRFFARKTLESEKN